MAQDALLARPTSAAFGGKQTATLKCNVTDEVSDEFNKFARERGYASTSDCLRELVIVALYGAETLTDLRRQRISALVRNWPDAKVGEGVSP